MTLTTDIYHLLYDGLRDRWLCLDDLGPDIAGVQVWLQLPGRCARHGDRRAPCPNVAVWKLDAAGTVSRYRRCELDGEDPPSDTGAVVAVRVLWDDGRAASLGAAEAAYLHPIVVRHRPEP